MPNNATQDTNFLNVMFRPRNAVPTMSDAEYSPSVGTSLITNHLGTESEAEKRGPSEFRYSGLFYGFFSGFWLSPLSSSMIAFTAVGLTSMSFRLVVGLTESILK